MADPIPTTSPYGTWASPIDSRRVVDGVARLGEPRLDGDDVYWTEARPEEGGRTTVLRRGPDGDVRDLVPAPYDVRTAVHEYGGAGWHVHDGVLVVSHFADGRLYRVDPGAGPVPLTPASGGQLRYADLRIDASRNRLICVREDQRPAEREPIHTLVTVPLDREHEGTVLVEGSDFHAGPRLDADGTRLAWIEWDHPNMPWDATRVRVAPIEGDGRLGTARTVAGGAGESIQQPLWTPEGDLIFVSDRSGWWNLYRERGGEVEALCPMESEFGVPSWAFGLSTVAMAAPRTLVCTFGDRLARLDLDTLVLHEIDTPYRRITDVRTDPSGRWAVFLGGAPTRADEIVRLDLASDAVEPLHSAARADLDAGYLSNAETIEFPTGGGRTAFAHYYPPTNRDHVAPEGELPPLLVKSHGGPTSAARLGLDLALQYWTSRGFAVVDVNYGGSTGHGRAYRQRLNGAWGIVDVDDCVNAARYLVERGSVDGARPCIHGRSAGGFTTLSALAFRDVFVAGGSHFGVADLEGMVAHTHKFESRYFDALIGPWPEAKERYAERSPIGAAERIDRPMIFFQGDEDAVVPPDQTERMVAALQEKGLPVAYRLFEGEQHGFRKAASIRASLDEEFSFFAQVFGFEPADDIERVAIEGL